MSVLTCETRAFLRRPCENDENDGCHAGKGMVYQRHGFLFPELLDFGVLILGVLGGIEVDTLGNGNAFSLF